MKQPDTESETAHDKCIANASDAVYAKSGTNTVVLQTEYMMAAGTRLR